MMSKSYFSQCIVALLLISMVETGESKRAGCAAPMDLPDKPFFVVWNHATEACEDQGIDLGFEKWGIVFNKGDRFTGEMITIFYDLGQWPRYYKNQTVWNGGIPQLGDLFYHLSKAQSDIKTNITNTTFDGLGVIDFESWRPLYSTNFDSLKIYQEKSLELAKQRFPYYNKRQLVQEATKEFESAARSFIGKTQQLAKSLRPNGRWGYYGYPRCWGDNATTTAAINDKMAYIFKESSALYPSIYFGLSMQPSVRETFVRDTVHETLRVKAKWSPTDVAVLPYAKNQDGPYQFFQPKDLDDAIRLPADMGSSGVVLWGTIHSLSAKNECTLLQDYINSTLGPYVMGVSNFFGNCTQQLCQGHGRCVRKDYEAIYQHHLRQNGGTDCLIPEDDLVRKKKGDTSGKDNTVQVKGKKSGVLRYNLERNTHTMSNLKRLTPYEHMLNNANLSSEGEDVEPSQWQDSVNRFEDNASLNDFDDYVCKCFAGWSGKHCEIKDQE